MEKPLYDLTLMLDASTDAEVRDKIVVDVETMITKSGEVVSRHDWGVRPTAYEVNRTPEIDFYLFQFHGPSELLGQLDHTLKITDGVVRFRVIKVKKGTPAPPDVSRVGARVESEDGPSSGRDRDRGDRGDRDHRDRDRDRY